MPRSYQGSYSISQTKDKLSDVKTTSPTLESVIACYINFRVDTVLEIGEIKVNGEKITSLE